MNIENFYKNDEAVFMPHEEEEKPKMTACPVCHGMGVRERPNGDTFDCPSVRCNNGFIKTDSRK